MLNRVWVVEYSDKQEPNTWFVSGVDMYRTKKYAMEMMHQERKFYLHRNELKFRVTKYVPES